MATVKFHEGTKIETSLDLEDGEGVIYSRPPQNGIYRNKGMTKTWEINLVLTDRRLVTIPVPPNKKSKQVESYYYKDIASISAKAAHSKDVEAIWAYFVINMKNGGNSKYEEGGTFDIRMVMNAKNFLTSLISSFKASDAAGPQYNGFAEYAAEGKTDASRAHAEATGASHYTVYSPNYAKMQKEAEAKVAAMDFSKMEHNQIRDIIIDLVNQYVEIANA